ncbi:MAG: Fur family transcriptional regulator [Chloroflexales bacterium]
MPNRPLSADTIHVSPDVWKQGVRALWHTAGSRVTKPRVRVLDAIMRYQTPFSAEQLCADLGQSISPPGRATVYRTIEQLSESGWLARIHTQTGEAGYVPSLPGHLHHLICTACGVVIAFEGCVLDDLLVRLGSQTDFAIEGHLLQIYGRCANCK